MESFKSVDKSSLIPFSELTYLTIGDMSPDIKLRLIDGVEFGDYVEELKMYFVKVETRYIVMTKDNPISYTTNPCSEIPLSKNFYVCQPRAEFIE